MSNAVMTTKEAAEYLRVDVTTITRKAKRGELPGRQVGNRWRFLRDQLDEWLRMSPAKELTQ